MVRFYSIKAVEDLLNTLKQTGAFSLDVTADHPSTLKIPVLFRTSQRGEKFIARILSWNKGTSILEPMLSLSDFSTLISSLVGALNEEDSEGEETSPSSDDSVIPFEEGHPPVLPKFTPEADDKSPASHLSPFDTAQPRSRLPESALPEKATAEEVLLADLISSDSAASIPQAPSELRPDEDRGTHNTPGSSGFLSSQTNPQARKGAFSLPQKETDNPEGKEGLDMLDASSEEQNEGFFSQLSSALFGRKDSLPRSGSQAEKVDRNTHDWITPNSLHCAAQFLAELEETTGINDKPETPASGEDTCSLVSSLKSPEPGALILVREENGARAWYLFLQNSAVVAAYQTPIPLEHTYTHMLSEKGQIKPDSVARIWRLITAYKLSEETVLSRLRIADRATLSALITERTEAVLSCLRMVPAVTYQIQQLSSFPEELESGQSDHLRFNRIYRRYLSMDAAERTTSINAISKRSLRLKIRPDILSETLELDEAMESLFIDCFSGAFSVETATSTSSLSTAETESALLSIMDMEWINDTND